MDNGELCDYWVSQLLYFESVFMVEDDNDHCSWQKE